jgi:hypothetical protein
MKSTVLTILLGLVLTGPGTGKAGEATDSIAKPLENRANGSEVNLEPYLKKTLPDLVAQIEAEDPSGCWHFLVNQWIGLKKVHVNVPAQYPIEHE